MSVIPLSSLAEKAEVDIPLKYQEGTVCKIYLQNQTKVCHIACESLKLVEEVK